MASPVDDYQCTLDEASLAVAEKELNEVPKERLSAVQTFRDWILQQKHIKCPTETEWLLRFLRSAKFSQLRARQILEGYLTMKKQLPEWYDNIDTHDEKIKNFIRSGYILPLGIDKNRRYTVLFRAGVLDVSKKYYTLNDIWHAMFALSLNLLHNENIMVNGINYIMDFTGFEMKHMTYWGMDNMKKSSKIWQGNFPGRFKGFHYYNTGPLFESIMAVLNPVLSKKLKDRIHIHSNLESIYELFPIEMMPSEYLPDDYEGPNAGTVDEIMEQLLKELCRPEVRKRILYESSPEWQIDLASKPADIPSESFRKLTVD